MKYRLLKDTPVCKAGAVFVSDTSGYVHVNQPPYDGGSWYKPRHVENNPEWFEPITDEPQFKIMSPAVCREIEGLYITDALFEDDAQAKQKYRQTTLFHSWPARHEDGSPVQYKIEVKK